MDRHEDHGRWRARLWAVVAALGLAVFYGVVIILGNGVGHLREQASADWYWLVLIIGGFGAQVGLLAELRRRHRLHHGAAAAGAAGAGASAAGMVACCAHHLADLVPIVGATGAAAFLLEWRVPLMMFGIAANSLGVILTVGRLRRVPSDRSGVELCAA